MAWTIELDASARKDLARLDPQIARQILKYLHERVANSESPRFLGDALKGSRWGNYWRYRVGDYRIICDLLDDELRVLVIKIGNRKEVYK